MGWPASVLVNVLISLSTNGLPEVGQQVRPHWFMGSCHVAAAAAAAGSSTAVQWRVVEQAMRHLQLAAANLAA